MEKGMKDTNWYFMEEIEMLSKYIKIFCLLLYILIYEMLLIHIDSQWSNYKYVQYIDKYLKYDNSKL